MTNKHRPHHRVSPPPPSDLRAMVASLRAFVADEDGSTVIEYALISSIVSVGAVTGYMVLGDAQRNIFSQWTDAVMSAAERSGS